MFPGYFFLGPVSFLDVFQQTEKELRLLSGSFFGWMLRGFGAPD